MQNPLEIHCNFEAERSWEVNNKSQCSFEFVTWWKFYLWIGNHIRLRSWFMATEGVILWCRDHCSRYCWNTIAFSKAEIFSPYSVRRDSWQIHPHRSSPNDILHVYIRNFVFLFRSKQEEINLLEAIYITELTLGKDERYLFLDFLIYLHHWKNLGIWRLI